MTKSARENHGKKFKCVVWDLDGTLWEGVLLEGDDIKLKPRVKEIIVALDDRGILHSIASKNDHETAMAKLREFGLADYFLYPEIHWSAKSSSITRIQQNLNIGLDAILFIDDQPDEREEVRQALPEVTCLEASAYGELPGDPRLNHASVTTDARRRRLMYLEDMQRKTEEREFVGPRKEFLASLNMHFHVGAAREEDLRRAAELVVRTNQLNTTGEIYKEAELRKSINSADRRLLVCEMEDRFGSYGKVGLALLERRPDHWRIKLLLMSCRVVSYGVGTVLLHHILREAARAGTRVRADYRPTGKNKMMYITLKFANFREVEKKRGGVLVLENDLSRIPRRPPHVHLKTQEAEFASWT